MLYLLIQTGEIMIDGVGVGEEKETKTTVE